MEFFIANPLKATNKISALLISLLKLTFVSNEVLSSGNYRALDKQVNISFRVGMAQDTRLARKLIQECASSSRYVYLSKPVVVLCCRRLQIINLRVMQEFRKHNILPPTIAVQSSAMRHQRILDGC